VEDQLDANAADLWSVIGEILRFILDEDTELEGLDHEVLFHYVYCTSCHVNSVMGVLRPSLRSRDRHERMSAFDELCDRAEPSIPCRCRTNLGHIAELAAAAIDLGEEAFAAARELGLGPEVIDELEFLLGHLDTILFIAEPSFYDVPDDASPDLRRALDETRQACIADVEFCKSVLRAELQSANN
jgi:hypothetical protein